MKNQVLEQRLSEMGYLSRSSLIKLLWPFLALLFVFFLATTVLLQKGLSIWGINIPVAWGFDITNFVWWIGIGHAGTFISAILLLLRQDWRNSINRMAESMTLFAVACAALYPLLHLGRPWFFYWLMPYPNDQNLYPQYRSPLVWDAFAVSTYMLVSIIFWYIGMIPDFAVIRENAHSKSKRLLFGILSLGWSGEIKEWATYKKTILFLAVLATPLVVSVHSIVSMDFSVAILPGWHSPLFPPYFVAGAIYSGFAMMICLLILIRHKFKLQDLIPKEHLNNCAKLLLASGMFVTFCYFMEFFMIWYTQEHFEVHALKNLAFGAKTWTFWIMLICNSAIVQLLWFPGVRRKEVYLFIISFLVLIGMWIERYLIIVTTLSDAFLPSAKGHYTPTQWDWMTFIGTFGIFGLGMLTVVRFLPFIPITEVKEWKEL